MPRYEFLKAFEFIYGKKAVNVFFVHLITVNKNNKQILNFINDHDIITLINKTERIGLIPSLDVLWEEWLQKNKM